MTNINAVVLIGNLTKDAELKYTSSGMAVLSFCIAVNRSKKQDNEYVNEASFFECETFGKYGESLSSYLIKGKQVGIRGSLKQDRWTGPDGANHSRIKILVEEINLLGGGQNNGQSQNNGYDNSGYGYNG